MISSAGRRRWSSITTPASVHAIGCATYIKCSASRFAATQLVYSERSSRKAASLPGRRSLKAFCEQNGTDRDQRVVSQMHQETGENRAGRSSRKGEDHANQREQTD